MAQWPKHAHMRRTFCSCLSPSESGIEGPGLYRDLVYSYHEELERQNPEIAAKYPAEQLFTDAALYFAALYVTVFPAFAGGAMAGASQVSHLTTVMHPLQYRYYRELDRAMRVIPTESHDVRCAR